MDEIYRRINATHANHTPVVDIGIPAPKLLQPSILISEDQSKQVRRENSSRANQGIDFSFRFYWNFLREYMVLIGNWCSVQKRMDLV